MRSLFRRTPGPGSRAQSWQKSRVFGWQHLRQSLPSPKFGAGEWVGVPNFPSPTFRGKGLITQFPAD